MRVLDRIVALRKGEAVTAWLMFAYSFLAMTSYNILKPITRSKFIDTLGADNLPYVQLGAGVVIGVVMHFYSQASVKLPRKAVIPVTQGALALILVVFWPLFLTGQTWVSVAFYVFGLIFGLLLISQFWTLANDVYDPRQARRVFGFIGAGASLGGATGAAITAFTVDAVGTNNLLPVSAFVLLLCIGAAVLVIRRQPPTSDLSLAVDERGVGGAEAFRLLRESRHLLVITMVIGFAAIGAVFIEQQLNMAAGASKDSADAITKFLAQIGIYLSLFGFLVQIGLTSRIHRALGLVFALLLLPVVLGSTAVLILLTGAIWAPSVARVFDTSLRYTIDKTTREVLFLPLPPDVKYRAKPFVDVTMDRFAKALGSVALLVLIKPWGLGLEWWQISYVSLIIMAAWIAFALVARREYLKSFRRRLETREVEPAAVRFDVADAATITLLVDRLSRPDVDSVLYAIDMLAVLGRHELITPLLLHHESARVRARALTALGQSDLDKAAAWLPDARRLLDDADPEVRAAAVRAVVAHGPEDGALPLRKFLDDPDPRVVVSAAVELADAEKAEDRAAAEAALTRLSSDRAQPRARQDVAEALVRIQHPAFRSMLIPLIHDPDVEVTGAAIASARAMGPSDAIFVPALVSRLGHRTLKSQARETLVSYGADIVDVLAHFLNDPDEPIWVRRHVPATLARIPGQRSMDVLIAALEHPDGFLRFKVVAALETLRQTDPALTLPSDAVEDRLMKETGRYYTYLTLRANLAGAGRVPDGSLLHRALDDKLARTLDRIYRLIGLLQSPADVAAARYAIEQDDSRVRASGIEYIDNVLHGAIRKRVLPIIDEAPLADKVRHANSVLKSRPRDVPDTLAQLVHEDDPVVAASALHFIVDAGVWADLEDDIDYILGHRRDPLVRDAAVWAKNMRAGGGTGADAPMPTVEVANRLRAIPVFAFVSIDELFRMADMARPTGHPANRTLYRQGEAAAEVLFLLDGTVRVTGGDPAPASVSAPAALNFADVLEGRALRHAVETATAVVAFTIDSGAFLTILTDNIATAQGLFRLLITSPAALDRAEPHPAAPAAKGTAAADDLDPVEKALCLQQMPMFSRATVEQLQALTAVTRQERLEPGAVLFGGKQKPAIYHVLSGEITIDAPGQAPLVLGAGGTIGAAETLTSTSAGRHARVTRSGSALRIGHDDLFEVLADHGDLLQGVFSGVLNTRAGH